MSINVKIYKKSILCSEKFVNLKLVFATVFILFGSLPGFSGFLNRLSWSELTLWFISFSTLLFHMCQQALRMFPTTLSSGLSNDSRAWGRTPGKGEKTQQRAKTLSQKCSPQIIHYIKTKAVFENGLSINILIRLFYNFYLHFDGDDDRVEFTPERFVQHQSSQG